MLEAESENLFSHPDFPAAGNPDAERANSTISHAGEHFGRYDFIFAGEFPISGYWQHSIWATQAF